MAEVAALKTGSPSWRSGPRSSRRSSTALAELPNLPADDVPDGVDETANVERHRFGAKRDYAFPPKQHFDLGEALGQMDFAAAAKLSGARFVVLKRPGAYGTRARAVHARCAHHRARLYRSRAAALWCDPT